MKLRRLAARSPNRAQLPEVSVSYVSGGAWACIGVLIAFGGFWAIGRLVPDREPWEYPLLGWSVSYLISVLAVLCGAANLKVGLVVCMALIVFSITRRRTTIQPRRSVDLSHFRGGNTHPRVVHPATFHRQLHALAVERSVPISAR